MQVTSNKKLCADEKFRKEIIEKCNWSISLRIAVWRVRTYSRLNLLTKKHFQKDHDKGVSSKNSVVALVQSADQTH